MADSQAATAESDDAAIPPSPLPPAFAESPTSIDELLADGGEMGALMRATDWASSPLGPSSRWPQALRTAVGICLGSRFPVAVMWGPELRLLYNDSYRAIIGDRHATAFGAASHEAFADIWHITGPLLHGVMSRGEAVWSPDAMIPLVRHGFLEECYFSYAYSPIRDESGGVGGVFCTVIETTPRVLGERRMACLRALASATALVSTAGEACEAAARVLRRYAADVPFALLYLRDEAATSLDLTASAGIEPDGLIVPSRVAIARSHDAAREAAGGWPLSHVLKSGEAVLVDGARPHAMPLPGTPWPEPSHAALVMPIARGAQPHPWGVIVAGLSPRLPLDETYRGFLTLLSAQVAAAIGSAHARGEERRRAVASAEAARHELLRVFHQVPSIVAVLRGREHRFEMANDAYLRFVGGRDVIGRTVREALPELEAQGFVARLDEVLSTGRTWRGHEMPIRLSSTPFSPAEERYLDLAYIPLPDPTGVPAGIIAYGSDVTEQVRARRAAERGRERLGVAVQAGRIGTWEIDLSTGRVERAGAVDALFGFAPDDGEAAPRELADFLARLAPADVATLTDRLDRLASGEHSTAIEVRVNLPGGGARWIAARGEPVRDANGRIVRLAGAVWDISEQREREHDQRFLAALSAALQALHEPVALVAEGARRLSEHLSVARVTLGQVDEARAWIDVVSGHAMEDVPLRFGRFPLGRALGQLLPDLEANRAVVVADARTDPRVAPMYGEFYEPFGTRAFVAMPLERHGQWVANLGVVDVAPREWTSRELTLLREVAERMWPAYEAARALAAERAARDRTQRLQTLTAALSLAITEQAVADALLQHGMAALGAVAGGVCLMTEDGRRQRLVSVVADGVATAVLAEWATFPIDEPYPVNEAVLRQVVVEAASFDEYRARWPALAAHMERTGFEAYIAAPLLVDGRAVGAVNYNYAECRAFADEDRALIATLAQLAAQALQRAWLFEAERAARAEAEAARAQAESANRAKTEFLAAMSHELRTPLNAIQGHTQLIEMELHGPVTDAQRDALGRIARSQRSLLMLINDVLNLARIESGHVTYEMTTVTMQDVVREIGGLIEPQLVARSLAYEIRMSEEPLLVHADRQKLEQVLLNLLSNAIKFTPEGGRVTVETGYRGDALDPAGMAWVRVIDTGRGIPRDKLESIFEPFVQVDARRTGTSEGVGLGLAISRDLARGMGGDVRARSAAGEGAVFTLTLRRVIRAESEPR